MKRSAFLYAGLTALLTLTACVPAALSGDEEAVVLFDGKSLAGWTMASGKPITGGWEAATDGTIHRFARAGDIVTERVFRDFELEFEFKAAPGTNSGVKYRYGDYGGKRIGLEYQVEHNPKAKGPTRHTTASLYDLFAPTAATKPLPETEWNRARIVVSGDRIEHWLNGEKRVSVVIGSPEWKSALDKSKFREQADFGAKPGRILLQEHGGEVWFRSLRLKELPAK